MARNHSSLSRRRFLYGTGALAACAALPRILFARTFAPARLVVVVLRGALDGLAAVPPHGDRDYAGLHRELAIAAPGSADGALDLNGFFGLHPSLEFLHERYRAKELVVFHAVASPYRERSHFDGQNVLENGLAQPLGTADGWLNRALAVLPTNSRRHAKRAVAISQNLPLILRGDAQALSMSPTATPEVDQELLARLADLYSKDSWFASRLAEAVQGEELMEASPVVSASPGTPGQPPPRSLVGGGPERVRRAASMAATLMRRDGGPEIAVFEAMGWDTHANQGASRGALAQRLAGLDGALRTLAEGLGPLWAATAVLVVTEFGRTAAVNGTRGTDHGTGGCAFMVGGAVRGGRVIADWPGLSRNALLDHRDLRPTVDLRSVFKAVLGEHMRIDSRSLASRVFPNSGGARPLEGLMRT